MNAALNRRTSDRTHPPEPQKILINEKRFILNDISREGIGILVEDSLGFSLGQRITSILLESHTDAQLLSGTVNHMSQNESGIICGIRFDFRNNTEFDYVQKINQSLMVA
jgi:c-di-GMP-binding flagellar brake protein YcgR